ncbi:MAG TPA: rod shape-determining protein [Opitutaceae bacterium]|jgi:rod shape-determining protein MreB|nr:rod shape-determining protein [Opitutaceae bacterium]
MTTATIEKQPTPAQTPAPAQTAAPRPPQGKATTLLVGLDLGTNKSCVLVGPAGTSDITVSKVVPSVVGYVKDGIVDGIITGNARVLFGEEALNQMLHVELVAPLAEGVISHPESARDFMQHIRQLADPSGKAEIRAVVGVPANADEEAREAIRRSAIGVFSRILLIPEPFLAALGYRDDSRVKQPGYVDPVVNSLFIDIGGGTSDLCLVQGYFPTKDDQISIPFAGDAIDSLLFDELNRTYPNNGLSRITVREIKETNAYVGPSRKPMDIKVVIGGKSRSLELGDAIGNACNTLIDKIYPALTMLIASASSDSVVTLLQNIIITGGGSQIRGIDTVLQKRLSDDGYEAPKVRLAGQDFQRYVAIGALKAARAARENQWQVLFA